MKDTVSPTKPCKKFTTCKSRNNPYVFFFGTVGNDRNYVTIKTFRCGCWPGSFFTPIE